MSRLHHARFLKAIYCHAKRLNNKFWHFYVIQKTRSDGWGDSRRSLPPIRLPIIPIRPPVGEGLKPAGLPCLLSNNLQLSTGPLEDTGFVILKGFRSGSGKTNIMSKLCDEKQILLSNILGWCLLLQFMKITKIKSYTNCHCICFALLFPKCFSFALPFPNMLLFSSFNKF